MSIIRTSHDKENPYVMLNKNALEDPNLSWQAKGLWAYLMSRPDNWNISVAHLSKIYGGRGGGEEAIWTMLKELIKLGYCERIKLKGEKGHFTKTEYVIKEFKNKLPHRSLPDPAPQGLENTGTNKEGGLINNEKQQQQQEVVVVQEKIKKMKSFLERFSTVHGHQWDLPIEILELIIRKYGIDYVSDQINYMTEQQTQALNDEKNTYLAKKTPKIEKPKKYLGICCKENWANSTHKL